MSDSGGITPEAGAAGEHYAAMETLIFESRSIAQIVRGAAELRLADLLADQPLTALQVAERGQLDPGATERFLKACVAFGLVGSAEPGLYGGTALLETLRSDDPRALRDLAIAQLGYAHWVSWGRLAEAVRTGNPQFADAHGGEWMEYYATDGAEEARAFARSLASLNAPLADQVTETVDATSAQLAIDLGGSNGSIVLALMKANPALNGAVLDLAHVGPGAEDSARELGLSHRFRFIDGDFFDEVPPADLYLLKNVLHDWPDEQCTALLQVCRKAAPEKSRLIVIDIIVDAQMPTRFEAIVDLTMLVGLGGRERTTDDFTALLDSAGFDIVTITPTTTPFSVIEAVPRT